MGKASSSKKVARAARVGGAKQGRRRQMAFPAAIVAILVLGTALVVFAQSENKTAAAVAPVVGDHWHAAYGFFVCDKFIDALPADPEGADVLGIHTHGDGIMHVHPFSGGAAGKNATFKVFGDLEGLTFQSNGFTMPDGTEYHDGYDCNGQPATVSVYQWDADDLSADPIIHTKDFGSIRYTQDRMAFTFAVVPEGTEVPPPDSVATLDNLTDVPGSGAQTSVPVDPAAGSTTLPPTDPSSTVPQSTTTAAAPPQ
jgi:hypothetical protein